MKRPILLATFALAATALLAAEPKTELQSALKKLADSGGYAWSMSSENADGRGRIGPTDGKVAADGTICLVMQRGERTMEAFLKGEKGVLKMEDQWRSLADVLQDDSEDNRRARFTARMLQNLKAPAAEATELLEKMGTLKKDGDAYAGDLSAEGVKSMLSRWRPPGGNAPAIKNPSGSARFWVKDGMLSKYEQTVKASVTFNDNEVEIDRITKVEIKDAGKVKFEVPQGAKEKL